jgi:hypothetical protein
MKKALFGLLFVASLAHADWQNPFEAVDSSKNFTPATLVTWRPVANPTKTCSEERSRRGFTQYGGAVEACSFWDGNTCLIITKYVTNRDTLGHELQHCFQGKWH